MTERGISVIRRWTKRTATTSEGKRSAIEDRVSSQLEEAGIKDVYEIGRIPYEKKTAHYIPDFILPNGIIIEVKGYFEPSDRTKHLLLKKQYPQLDLRFVFQNPKLKLNKKSSTSYADWCDKHGFEYAHKWVPKSWFSEPINMERIALIKEVLIPSNNARN